MKRGPLLVDTGFLVALVNAHDPAHEACADLWTQIQGPFFSVEGVLTETAWLVRKEPGAFRRAVGLAQSVDTLFIAPTPWRYRRAVELMERYAKVPMDFVDAHLVAFAEDAELLDVLTLDRRGFGMFRAAKDRAFRLLP